MSLVLVAKRGHVNSSVAPSTSFETNYEFEDQLRLGTQQFFHARDLSVQASFISPMSAPTVPGDTVLVRDGSEHDFSQRDIYQFQCFAAINPCHPHLR
jgi:hypothetical protein